MSDDGLPPVAVSRAEEYRLKAEEAERSAAKAKSETERTAYERIARGWRELETHARRRERRGL